MWRILNACSLQAPRLATGSTWFGTVVEVRTFLVQTTVSNSTLALLDCCLFWQLNAASLHLVSGDHHLPAKSSRIQCCLNVICVADVCAGVIVPHIQSKEVGKGKNSTPAAYILGQCTKWISSAKAISNSPGGATI